MSIKFLTDILPTQEYAANVDALRTALECAILDSDYSEHARGVIKQAPDEPHTLGVALIAGMTEVRVLADMLCDRLRFMDESAADVVMAIVRDASGDFAVMLIDKAESLASGGPAVETYHEPGHA